MEYLLDKRNLKILESFCLVKTLFAFDYDGTLAPITKNPDTAFMTDETATLLKELNEISPVAIITGRSVSDIEKLLPIRPAFLIGNHGAEGTHTEAELERMRVLTRTWLRQIEDMFPVLNKLGVSVEDKEYSLSFHYRNAATPDVAQKAVELMIERLPHSRVVGGKFVFNVLPDFSVDKGKAVELIMKENNYQFGVYFGDDQTDEDVFHYHNPRLLTVKIGSDPTEAKFYLRYQSEMNEALHLVSGFIRKSIPAL